MKVAVIGCGTIANAAHIPSYMNNNKVEIKYFCDIRLERAEKAVEKYGCGVAIKDYKEVLADPEVIAVSVCTPNNVHSQISIDALKAGKHVLCEKPATITPEQLRHVLKSAKDANKLFMEAMTIGLNPMYQAIKKLIAEDVIGEITHVESSMGAMSSKAHKHTPELAGGCIYDIGIYNLFFQYDLLGPVVRMQTQKRMHRTWDVVGTVQLISEHANGGESYAFMTMDALSTGRAAIIGTKGTIELAKGWTMGSSYTITTADGRHETVEYTPTR